MYLSKFSFKVSISIFEGTLPLYLFVIGIPSIMWAWLGDDNKCYYDFYTERWANKHAGLEVLRTASGRCFLSVKNVLGYKG